MVVRELITRFGFALNQSQVTNVDKSVERVKDRAEQAASAFRNIVTSIAGIATIRTVIGIADEMQNMRTRIGQLPQTIGEASDAFDEVVRRANAAGQSVTAYGTLYSRLGNSAKSYIKTQEDLLGITDTISQALVVGGANAQEASSVMIQFAQALGSGVLQGDEFRAMAEAAPQYLDKLSEAMNIPREQLKKMASEGKLTSRAVIEATRKMSTYFSDKFNQMPMTVGRAMTIIGNRFARMLDKMNRDTNFVTRIANFFLLAFDKIENGVDAVVKLFGGWENAIRHIGITLAVALGFKALSILSAFKIASIAAMAPFIKMTLLITAVSLAIEDLFTWIEGGESLIGSMIGPWEDWSAYVLGAIEMVTDAVKWFGRMLGAVAAILIGAFTLNGDLFLVGLEGLTGMLFGKLAEWGKAIYTTFFDPIVRAVSDAWNVVTTKLGGAFESVKGFFGGGAANTAGTAGAGAANTAGTAGAGALANGVTPAQMIGPSVGVGGLSVQNKTEVNVTVPPGTTAEQAAFLERTAQKTFDKKSNDNFARSLAVYAP